MKKLVLTSAAMLFTSLMATPVYAGEMSQGQGCKNGKDSYCDLKIKAHVKKQCNCYFSKKNVDLGYLNYDKHSYGDTKLYVKCNSKKAYVTAHSQNYGLKGAKGYGSPIHWDLMVGDYKVYSSYSKEYADISKYVKDGYIPLKVKSHKYDFYKVYPGHKSDRLIVKVSPIVYY
ncbi:hypothetical protein MD588_00150 [Photobacterium sp. SDRW27]|uniref:hypothetical protein n=1 Tax=Photobacterium obscurum TaxID=2829490 RepID=UPI002244A285|nr:hypothetical protein [Photobacterium obscurum]MCW8327211.1 hypothetical protein [Photobacterium obscurum]